MKNFILMLTLGLFLAGCSTSKQSSSDASKTEDRSMALSDSEVSAENALESYLNRTPGVVVNGSGSNARVQVRGVNSFSGNTEPLFIINGNDVGNNYQRAASLLRGMKIKSVEVLKNADASLYGVRGAGGVILIKAE